MQKHCLIRLNGLFEVTAVTEAEQLARNHYEVTVLLTGGRMHVSNSGRDFQCLSIQ